MISRISRAHEVQKPARSVFTELVDIPKNVNDGLHSASGALVESILGKHDSVRTLNLLKSTDVGPFTVQGLHPALESLRAVLLVVKNQYPNLYCRLTPNGMRVVKKIEGTRSRSLHSWGVAIDLKIDGIEDVKWDDKAFHGLALMAPIFNQHGWFWGGAFRDKETKRGSRIYQSNEDAMHFEVSKEKLLEWQKAGMFGPISKNRQERIPPADSSLATSSSPEPPTLTLRKGDKGPYVVSLQDALRFRDYAIKADGRFGTKTESAVVDFQRKHGLTPNGIVGPKTALYLAMF